MRILIIENGYRDLVKSRYPLADFFISKGHLVFYTCPNPPKNSGIYDLNILMMLLNPKRNTRNPTIKKKKH